MRHVRDVIRLKSAGMPTREIARRLGTAPGALIRRDNHEVFRDQALGRADLCRRDPDSITNISGPRQLERS